MPSVVIPNWSTAMTHCATMRGNVAFSLERTSSRDAPKVWPLGVDGLLGSTLPDGYDCPPAEGRSNWDGVVFLST